MKTVIIYIDEDKDCYFFVEDLDLTGWGDIIYINSGKDSDLEDKAADLINCAAEENRLLNTFPKDIIKTEKDFHVITIVWLTVNYI